jgi:general L-amino acid transport system substrate-binding protein
MPHLAAGNRHATRRGLRLALAAAGAALLASALPAAAQTLDAVKKRGELVCGVSQGLLGFSSPDDKGDWAGFDVDFCRAVAAAALGDATKVKFVPLSAAERFEALKGGKVDLLARNSTWTLGRETEFGIAFTGVTYYDGQGFMVAKTANTTSALELDGAKVCVQAGTTTKDNVVDYFAQNGMKGELIEVASPADALKAYSEGRCGVLTSDVSQLHAERLRLEKPGDHVILADIISKEPLGPVVRADDAKWFTLVKWVGFALVNAEELGVSTKTLDAALASKKPDVQRLVGTEGKLGESLGVSNDWAAKAVKAVGNYGEIYERNVGRESKLAIPRGINQLWSMGGILYAPPVR